MADLNFSVCIEMLFTDLPLLARPAAVAAAGYSAIEFWHWSGKPMDDLQAAADAAGVKLVCFHCEAGVPLVNPGTLDWPIRWPCRSRLPNSRGVTSSREEQPAGDVEHNARNNIMIPLRASESTL
ncbi:MAG: hypothetical protein WCP21_03055 [Armatimonadota bacterium]